MGTTLAVCLTTQGFKQAGHKVETNKVTSFFPSCSYQFLIISHNSPPFSHHFLISFSYFSMFFSIIFTSCSIMFSSCSFILFIMFSSLSHHFPMISAILLDFQSTFARGQIVSQLGVGMTDTETSKGAWEAGWS